jgi:hypothetical protein
MSGQFPPYIVSVIAIIVLSACGGSAHFEFDNLEDAMSKEAACVVSAELFGMYDAAKRHAEHGKMWGKVRFEIEKIPNEFRKHIRTARGIVPSMAPATAANFLIGTCNERMSHAIFDDYTGLE